MLTSRAEIRNQVIFAAIALHVASVFGWLFRAAFWIPLLLVAAIVIMLQGCAGLNPVAVAQTPEQKYDAVVLTYDAVLGVAEDMVTNPSTPPTVRDAVRAAAVASGQAYGAAKIAYAEFLAAKKALAAGASTNDKFQIAASNLANWTGQLETALARLHTLTGK